MLQSRFWAVALLAYVITVSVGVEAINTTWGYVLPRYIQEGHRIEGSGGGKMRAPLDEFQQVLLIFGTWVYPASIIAASLFTRQAIAGKSKIQKVTRFICAGICLGILGRFLWLGVFSAGLGI
jgi:hypothetical protein